MYGLSRVSKAFGVGDRRSIAVREITLDIAAGEQIALIGPSGSGKTTLFRLMNCSIFPSSGTVLYRQNDVSALSQGELRAIRRKIGCIYQQHYLVPGMSVLANTLSGGLGRWGLTSSLRHLVCPRGAEVDRAEHCLEAVGLADKRRFRSEQLSGGQQQRLAIARTLMQDPEVILADEPVSSLDPVLSEDILNLLVRLAEDGRFTLMTSFHQIELALRHSKRVVAIREGTVALDMPTGSIDARSLLDIYRNDRNPAAEPDRPAQLGESANVAESGQKRACLR
jgi:phosphonate transport system ATP-binding protein